MDAVITVYLHTSATTYLEVQVHADDNIAALYQYLPNGQGTYFYFNNVPLTPAFSFGYNGIKDGDHIFAIPKPVRSAPAVAKKKKSVPVRDRMIDQYFQHAEGTVRTHRKLVCELMGRHNQPTTNQCCVPTTIPGTSSGPSTDAFPVGW